MQEFFETRSLRFWVALGMIIAMAPFTVSAVVGFIIIERGIIAPIHDVAARQADQLGPTQRLQLQLQDVLIAVDDFVVDGDPRHLETARHLRGLIEAGFVQLIEKVKGDPVIHTLVSRAHDLWTASSDDATQLLSVVTNPGDAADLQNMQRFHGDISATSDELGVVSDQLAEAIESDHQIAILNYERTMWLAGLAGIISLMAMIIGVYLIGRIIGLSVDRLVDGATRFAEGDRDHRITIAVPPELRRVAEEFNRMIGRVHVSEEALASLAHLDGLTGLPNRRSFDTAFDEVLSRFERLGEPVCLLMLDIDHFKRINDSFGHSAGDEALRALASIMGQSVRPYDHVFRIGGEEFAVLLPNTQSEEARKVAERVRESVAAARVNYNGNEISLTISIGLAEAPKGAEIKALLDAADAALYRAKAAGRNRVVVSGE